RRAAPTNPYIEFRKEDIEQSIVARFERQAEIHADRLAVKTSGMEMSYRALNHATNQIAHAILAQGGAEHTRVAVLVEHGAFAIATILGVLKASKTYVPLDPSFPRARNAYIFDDSESELVVSDAKNFDFAACLGSRARTVINVDRLDASVGERNPGLKVSPDQHAYILYTSGSTGQPKGVLQNHRNVLNDIRQYTNTLAISADDRMTLLYSFSVNGAVRGIFGALLNGASLFPLDVKTKGFASLAQMMQRERITFYHSVPTMFRHFAATLNGGEDFSALRVIRFGG
ncbi:MAG: AMP-binding protein, partial [Burkholderiales bacterium]